jgi:hypothetical protein
LLTMTILHILRMWVDYCLDFYWSFIGTKRTEKRSFNYDTLGRDKI